jgi:hypothetical protein
LPDSIGLGGSSKPSDGLHARFPHYGYHDMVARAAVYEKDVADFLAKARSADSC